MNALQLSYTPPEQRAATPEPRDPMWRRLLIDLGLRLMSFSERFYTPGPGIGWRDHLRWKIEGWGSRIFDWGHKGSLSEEEMIFDGLIPFLCLDLEDRLKFLPHIPAQDLVVDLSHEVMHRANNLYDAICELDAHPAFRLLGSEDSNRIKAILSSTILELRDLSQEIREMEA